MFAGGEGGPFRRNPECAKTAFLAPHVEYNARGAPAVLDVRARRYGRGARRRLLASRTSLPGLAHRQEWEVTSEGSGRGCRGAQTRGRRVPILLSDAGANRRGGLGRDPARHLPPGAGGPGHGRRLQPRHQRQEDRGIRDAGGARRRERVPGRSDRLLRFLSRAHPAVRVPARPRGVAALLHRAARLFRRDQVGRAGERRVAGERGDA